MFVDKWCRRWREEKNVVMQEAPRQLVVEFKAKTSDKSDQFSDGTIAETMEWFAGREACVVHVYKLDRVVKLTFPPVEEICSK